MSPTNQNGAGVAPSKPAAIKRLSAAELEALKKLGLGELRKLADKYELPNNGLKADLVMRLSKAGVRASIDKAQPVRSSPRRGVRASAPLEQTAGA